MKKSPNNFRLNMPLLTGGLLLLVCLSPPSLAQTPGIPDVPAPVSAKKVREDNQRRLAEAAEKKNEGVRMEAGRNNLAKKAKAEEKRRRQAEDRIIQLEADLAEQTKKAASLAILKTSPVADPPAPQKVGVTAAGSQIFAPGTEFRDDLKGGGKGPLMVVLPPGRYWQGAAPGEIGADADEKAQRLVKIDYKLAIGKFSVTFDDWAQCVAGGGCTATPKPDDRSWGKRQRPVINVNYLDAEQYVTWLNGKSLDKSHPYRLLSEMEWEYAARGESDGKKDSQPFVRLKMADGGFSSGTCISTDQANYDGNYEYNNCGAKSGKYRQETVEVGSLLSQNQFGLFDMSGNVWHWLADCYYDSYTNPAVPALTNEKDGGAAQACGKEERRVVRGGSWYYYPVDLRAASRYINNPAVRSGDVGIRLSRTVP